MEDLILNMDNLFSTSTSTSAMFQIDPMLADIVDLDVTETYTIDFILGRIQTYIKHNNLSVHNTHVKMDMNLKNALINKTQLSYSDLLVEVCKKLKYPSYVDTPAYNGFDTPFQ